MRARSTIVLAALLLASAAVAAKPPSPGGGGGDSGGGSGTTAPQIAFVNISGGTRRHYQLRVADEDGSHSATLYDTRDIGQMVPHMGPAGDKTIVLVQGGKVSLVRYTTSSTGTAFQSIETLLTVSSQTGAVHVDFSPNGNDIAWFDNSARELKVFHLDSGTSTTVTPVGFTEQFSFTGDGSEILYLEYIGQGDEILWRVPSGGGTPVKLLEGDYSGVEPAHSGSAFILTRSSSLKTSTLEYFSSPSSGSTTLATGYVPSFACDDSTIIYQRVNSDGSVSLLRRDMATGLGYTTSSTGNYWPDYVGC
jgi:Tol biopolymer transport system component